MAIRRLFICLSSITLVVTSATDAKKDAKSTSSRSPRFNPEGLYGYGTGYSSDTCDCDVRVGSQQQNSMKIMNGTVAEFGEFPWRCYLFMRDGHRVSACGCSILSPDWILTAAHCAHGWRARHMTVYAGLNDLTRPDDDNVDAVKVAKIVKHENYNKKIALLWLERSLDFTKPHIKPVCMPYKFKGRTFDWQIVTASGWGTASMSGRQSLILKKFDIQVVPLDVCQNWRPYKPGDYVIVDTYICAYGIPVSTSGGCSGDSGGGIDYRDPAWGRYYVVGIPSWVDGCPRDLPNIFKDVTKYADWIDYQAGVHMTLLHFYVYDSLQTRSY